MEVVDFAIIAGVVFCIVGLFKIVEVVFGKKVGEPLEGLLLEGAPLMALPLCEEDRELLENLTKEVSKLNNYKKEFSAPLNDILDVLKNIKENIV